MRQEEEIEFEVIRNSGNDNQLLILNSLKNLIAQQLSQIPRTQITKNIFDMRSESMIIKKGTELLGGANYTYIDSSSKLCNLQYYAVADQKTRKGYGSMLLSSLKNYLCQNGIELICTQADSFSINFYLKHGFVQVKRQSCRPWVKHLTEYSHTSLLVYKLCPRLDYFKGKQKVSKQMDMLLQLFNGLQYRQFKYDKTDIEDILKTKYEKIKHRLAYTKSAEVGSELEGEKWSRTEKLQKISRLEAIALVELLKGHKSCWIIQAPMLGEENNHRLGIKNLREIQMMIPSKTGIRISQEICSEVGKTIETLSRELPAQSKNMTACLELADFARQHICSILNGTFDLTKFSHQLKTN